MSYVRSPEARLNALPHFMTEIDGLDIHFIHVRSGHDNALPLIVTHGWPGSVIEQLKIIGPLTDPAAHGASASDAFHLVIPSLPLSADERRAFEQLNTLYTSFLARTTRPRDAPGQSGRVTTSSITTSSTKAGTSRPGNSRDSSQKKSARASGHCANSGAKEPARPDADHPHAPLRQDGRPATAVRIVAASGGP
ncbi:MAG: epoxide hydrolase N-terminal domain-containing protein [Streptosporangiaceae bacterium]